MKPITFVMSDKCNITCDFCAPNCGPNHKKFLDADAMIKVYEEVSQAGYVPLVVFTGGEPTLFLSHILRTIKYIRKTSDCVIRIVTNAYFGISKKQSLNVLGKLKEAGLSEINFSVDDFHQEHIPLSSVKNAAEAAVELGLSLLFAHKSYPGGQSSKETYESLLDRSIDDLNDLIDLPSPYLAFSSGQTIPVGRGVEKIDMNDWVSKSEKANWRGPCNEVFKAITASPNGSLSPCCGLVDRSLEEFYIGDVRKNHTLSILKKANKSLLYNWLALEGPSGIMDEISQSNEQLQFRGEYVQNCGLCQEIFSCEEKKREIKKVFPNIADRLSIKRVAWEAQRSCLSSKMKTPDFIQI